MGNVSPVTSFCFVNLRIRSVLVIIAPSSVVTLFIPINCSICPVILSSVLRPNPCSKLPIAVVTLPISLWRLPSKVPIADVTLTISSEVDLSSTTIVPTVAVVSTLSV